MNVLPLSYSHIFSNNISHGIKALLPNGTAVIVRAGNAGVVGQLSVIVRLGVQMKTYVLCPVTIAKTFLVLLDYLYMCMCVL